MVLRELQRIEDPTLLGTRGLGMKKWNENEIVISATHDKERLLSYLKPQTSRHMHLVSVGASFFTNFLKYLLAK